MEDLAHCMIEIVPPSISGEPTRTHFTERRPPTPPRGMSMLPAPVVTAKYSKARGKWVALDTSRGHIIELGDYDSKEEALAHDRFAPPAGTDRTPHVASPHLLVPITIPLSGDIDVSNIIARHHGDDYATEDDDESLGGALWSTAHNWAALHTDAGRPADAVRVLTRVRGSGQVPDRSRCFLAGKVRGSSPSGKRGCPSPGGGPRDSKNEV